MARPARLQWTHDGRTQSLRAWAQEVGATYETLYARHYVLGWTIAQALTAQHEPRWAHDRFAQAVARYYAERGEQ